MDELIRTILELQDEAERIEDDYLENLRRTTDIDWKKDYLGSFDFGNNENP